MGFAETIAALLRYDDPWFERSVGVALVLLLLVINIAGVKWVVRLQFMLLLILFFAALDFAVGICIQRDPCKPSNVPGDHESGANFLYLA